MFRSILVHQFKTVQNAEIVKLLHNFFQKNETEQRLSVGIITPYLGQAAGWQKGSEFTGKLSEQELYIRSWKSWIFILWMAGIGDNCCSSCFWVMLFMVQEFKVTYFANLVTYLRFAGCGLGSGILRKKQMAQMCKE